MIYLGVYRNSPVLDLPINTEVGKIWNNSESAYHYLRVCNDF